MNLPSSITIRFEYVSLTVWLADKRLFTFPLPATMLRRLLVPQPIIQQPGYYPQQQYNNQSYAQPHLQEGSPPISQQPMPQKGKCMHWGEHYVIGAHSTPVQWCSVRLSDMIIIV